jgi:hypothetical protein
LKPYSQRISIPVWRNPDWCEQDEKNISKTTSQVPLSNIHPILPDKKIPNGKL